MVTIRISWPYVTICESVYQTVDVAEWRAYCWRMNNALAAFEAARLAVSEEATAGLSQSTINRRWAAYFKAEDALKAAVGPGAR